MNSQEIINAWTDVGCCEAREHEIGMQIINLTAEMRKCHQATRTARDIAEHLLEDKVI